jgi:DNA-directed RNA polymerase subunit RPC12/RpoP
MATRNKSVKEWECDACGKKVMSEGKPAGWTDETITISTGLAESIKGIDVCDRCSKDPEAAKRQAKARYGQ